MLTALWVRPRGQTDGGRFVRELRRDDADPVLALTPYEARRLAAELNAHADAYEPRPPVSRGRSPFGWRRMPPGWCEPDLEEQRTIDMVIEHVLDGYRSMESVRALNALGRHTRDGRPWTKHTMRLLRQRLQREGVLAEPATRPAQNPEPELPL